MRRVGQARRRDANEPEVIKALQEIGLVVFQLSDRKLGDLIVYDPWAIARASWTMLEVKNGAKAKLTAAQQERPPIPTVWNAAEAVALFVNKRRWMFEDIRSDLQSLP